MAAVLKLVERVKGDRMRSITFDPDTQVYFVKEKKRNRYYVNLGTAVTMIKARELLLENW